MFVTLGYMLFLIILLSRHCSGRRQPLRVYGGEDADPEAYPYVVRLEISLRNKLTNGNFIGRHSPLCTASALSPTWAVTAAHCLVNLQPYIYGFPFSKLVIRYVSVNSTFESKNTFSRVLSVIPHPTYLPNDGAGRQQRNKNDIGLVKTSYMALKSYMKLSAVDFNTMYGHEAVYTGFGMTTKTLSDGEIVIGDTLELKMPLQMFKVLIKKCDTDKQLVPSFCLGQRCGAQSTVCGGDSGGPLIHASGVVAVLSAGVDFKYCGDNTANEFLDLAGIVSPLGPVIEWIVSYVRS